MRRERADLDKGCLDWPFITDLNRVGATLWSPSRQLTWLDEGTHKGWPKGRPYTLI